MDERENERIERMVLKLMKAAKNLAEEMDHVDVDFAPNLIEALSIFLVATLHENCLGNFARKELYLRRVNDNMIHHLLRLNNKYGENSEKPDEDAEGSDRSAQE